MYQGKKVSVVISTYQEKNSIKKFVNDCFSTQLVDEVIVVNNNAEIGTNDEVKQTKATLIHESKQGYGHGYQRGLREASGDLIIMTEADGTFTAHDFEKLLVFSKDFPVIFCTRTATHAIHDGANMGIFLKWGNWAVAKMIEVLFWTTELSDVGCTTRLLRRDALNKIQPLFSVGDSYFGLEMILLTVLARIPFVELPIHYLPRVGVSAVTGYFHKTFILGMTMIYYTLKTRINIPLKKKVTSLEVGDLIKATAAIR